MKEKEALNTRRVPPLQTNFRAQFNRTHAHMSTNNISESKKRFQNYDFDKDENWLKYKRSLEIPSDLPNLDEVLQRLKQKWYKKNIVSDVTFIQFFDSKRIKFDNELQFVILF
jgi:hypothetical protein